MIRRRAALALVLLPAAVPLGALALADDDPAAPDPAPPNVVVAEQVTAARSIVPFGLTTEGGTRTAWATGRTRRPSAYSGQDVTPPGRDDAAPTLLLQGTIAGDDRAAAWRRAAAPLDRDGNALPIGGWRIDDGSGSASTDAVAGGDALHAGETTPSGAAALLVRIGGSAPRAAVLARTSDGRFRELPAPPGTDPFAAPAGAVTPMAVVDEPKDDGAPERGRTGVLLAPAGASGVLRWDGASWSEEPWEDDDGDPLGARTALALGATPDGDAVALFAGPSGGDRVALARRDTTARAFRPVALDGSALLTGALPGGVKDVRPVAAPGQPLTVTRDHWWLDLLVTRDDDVVASTTVHLRPGTTATASGTWCSPSVTGCDRDLRFGFATSRGYRSQAFADDDASHPFGQRAISSPVIPEAPGDARGVGVRRIPRAARHHVHAALRRRRRRRRGHPVGRLRGGRLRGDRRHPDSGTHDADAAHRVRRLRRHAAPRRRRRRRRRRLAAGHPARAGRGDRRVGVRAAHPADRHRSVVGRRDHHGGRRARQFGLRAGDGHRLEHPLDGHPRRAQRAPDRDAGPRFTHRRAGGRRGHALDQARPRRDRPGPPRRRCQRRGRVGGRPQGRGGASQ